MGKGGMRFGTEGERGERREKRGRNEVGEGEGKEEDIWRGWGGNSLR